MSAFQRSPAEYVATSFQYHELDCDAVGSGLKWTVRVFCVHHDRVRQRGGVMERTREKTGGEDRRRGQGRRISDEGREKFKREVEKNQRMKE